MNLTPHDVDGGHRKRECKIETEKYSEVLQLSSGPSQDPAERLGNSKNSKDSNADLTASNAGEREGEPRKRKNEGLRDPPLPFPDYLTRRLTTQVQGTRRI